MTISKENWSGSFAFAADRLAAPRSVDELQEIVAGSERAHVVGAGHSFSRIADTTGTLLSLASLPPMFEPGGSSVRVGAGMRLAELAARLDAHGLALPTMPSLPHITIAGACATATHGSGAGIGSFADMVRSLDLVTADGSLVTLRRGDDRFDGAVVSFGGLGAVVAMEVDVRPGFEVEQRVYRDLPWDVLVDHLEPVLTCAYSVSVFTTWRGTAEVWVKRRTDDPPVDLGWTGAREASEPRHPVPGQPAEHTTQQLGVPGRWHERLPHFRAEFTPSVGAELQSEFFVAAADAPDALRALGEVREHITPVLLTCELRTIDADEQWLSPTYGRPSVAFHLTWRQDAPAVTEALRHMERALVPWKARPHWAKLFATPREELRARYEHWSRFAALLDDLDPDGTFRNDAIDGWFPH